MLLLRLGLSAQEADGLATPRFFNLTAEEVRIDSLLPTFSQAYELSDDYQDKDYTVSIEYPEFIDMSPTDIRRLQKIMGDEPALPALPAVTQFIGTSRRRASLSVSFVPLVFRDGHYQKLVSFMLKVSVTEKTAASARRSPSTRADGTADFYAPHSVLAQGVWAKIRVPATGIYQLTNTVIRQAGFSHPDKVKIYGYGGALQPERLNSTYLQQTDDLQEVPTCTVGGKRLFHAVGPVEWSSATATERIRNPYSDYGYYFLTESDEEPLTVDSATFVSSFYPTTNDYHSLHEVDNFAWYHTGRNLYEGTLLSSQDHLTYELTAHEGSGRLTVALTANGPFEATVTMNDSLLGKLSYSQTLVNKYTYGILLQKTFDVTGLMRSNNRIELRQTSGQSDVHTDYVVLTMDEPMPLPDLRTASFPAPQYVYRITNQDHHADGPADLVIIIPTTQRVVAQAERLKALHEQYDSMRVNIVPADELFNEFSSGTPDANAYRRYLKMLYDRAETEADMPRYLLLFGDGAWDNRMLSTDWQTQSPDDYLLCFESENSFSATDGYVSDDFFCMLDEGEGQSLTRNDLADVGVGRLPARTAAEAKVMVDKIIDYRLNAHAGDWQNTLCFMGDDGNGGEGNVHMHEANTAATQIVDRYYPGFNIKKIFWDAYEITYLSTGAKFPDVDRLVRDQMQAGALIMDYCGHGAPYMISHEKVLQTEDFAKPTSLRLPLWVTASCDIMPYDSYEVNIGETAMLNPKGGAVAFFGTTRTVYVGANMNMNCAFIKHVLATVDGRRNTLGDAVRLSKNDLRLKRDLMQKDSQGNSIDNYATNKLHYSLLGDPALTLASPMRQMVIDSINGQPVGDQPIALGAGNLVTVSGYVADAPDFEGTVALTVKGEEVDVRCRMSNPESGADTAYVFRDRPSTFYSGQDNVRSGRFSMNFVLPYDISYSSQNGLMTLYAFSSDRSLTAHGAGDNFTMGAGSAVSNDGIGPSIYCYLNSSSFSNGGNVNSTPYFFAELTDREGINVAGNGLGHNLELCVDGNPQLTYDLTGNFQFNFGDYRSGTVGYALPELSEGAHTLLFRAWDVLNNSSVAELKFNVVRGLSPQCFDITCTHNPATTSTTFIVTHDRTGSAMDVVLEIFDMSGRQLWRHAETGVPTDNTYSVDWDLVVDSGSRLQTGVYLYRVLITTEGSTKASPAKKLIILNK